MFATVLPLTGNLGDGILLGNTAVGGAIRTKTKTDILTQKAHFKEYHCFSEKTSI